MKNNNLFRKRTSKKKTNQIWICSSSLWNMAEHVLPVIKPDLLKILHWASGVWCNMKCIHFVKVHVKPDTQDISFQLSNFNLIMLFAIWRCTFQCYALFCQQPLASTSTLAPATILSIQLYKWNTINYILIMNKIWKAFLLLLLHKNTNRHLFFLE